ncbi:MAG: hypothetical protein UU77_C0020G0002 [candidate division WWE3 bacterium GW2011_GWC1_41_7]|uniref:Uncharacterized protein n=3 Tax=Katanobacteria TaxID=422282 RepID=A0A0G0ZL50_UNCKA|nr:MAG: hypothetical protein UU72_C0004G0012 [candidate division WWE3 bacterium GW2011_GWB1_41_6]KKS20675.1 MAG: hypothetical protein UU77_C0020G0002 [candidate division WWE3 bacterium GW2011_GWC1_41_7]KKS22776.1 MAG: hypothetical protein UU80_C0002G0008 [candidate division WWE3 bacterium GW2011_GWA1_41_8]
MWPYIVSINILPIIFHLVVLVIGVLVIGGKKTLLRIKSIFAKNRRAK